MKLQSVQKDHLKECWINMNITTQLLEYQIQVSDLSDYYSKCSKTPLLFTISLRCIYDCCLININSIIYKHYNQSLLRMGSWVRAPGGSLKKPLFGRFFNLVNFTPKYT